MENLNALLTTEFKIGDDIIQIIMGNVMGDSLCMNPLAGLSASFNNFIKFPCRQCVVTQDAYKKCECPNQFFELAKDLRTNYTPGLNNGIRTETPLRQLPGFQVWNDMPGDVWHNFHGGTGKDYFGLAIKYLMKKKLISIEDLAHEYKKIPLKKGKHKCNPIPPLNKKHYTEQPYPSFQGSFKEFSTIVQITPVAFRALKNYRNICASTGYKLLAVLATIDDLFSRLHIAEWEIDVLEQKLKEMFSLRFSMTKNKRYVSDTLKYEKEKRKRAIETAEKRRKNKKQKRQSTREDEPISDDEQDPTDDEDGDECPEKDEEEVVIHSEEDADEEGEDSEGGNEDEGDEQSQPDFEDNVDESEGDDSGDEQSQAELDDDVDECERDAEGDESVCSQRQQDEQSESEGDNDGEESAPSQQADHGQNDSQSQRDNDEGDEETCAESAEEDEGESEGGGKPPPTKRPRLKPPDFYHPPIKPKAHFLAHSGDGIRNFGPAHTGTSTLRGEQNHRLFKTITTDSNQRKSVVLYAATMAERKSAFLAKRYPLVNPTRQFKKLGKRIKHKTRKRVVDCWKAYGLGEFVELKSLTILNTKFPRNTFYFKSETEFCEILNLVQHKTNADIVGFYGRVWQVKVDSVTGALVYEKIQTARFNLVVLSEFTSKFYEVGKPVFEHHIRRNVYYSYNYGRDYRNKEKDSGLMALVP